MCTKNFWTEKEHAKSQAPNSLKELLELFSEDADVQLLKTQMHFIKEKSDVFVDATALFQSQSPLATSVWSMLQSMVNTFDAGGVTMRELEKFCAEDTPRDQKLFLMDIFNQAFALVDSKLQKFMKAEGQPGIDFLQHEQFFHPAKVIMVPAACELSGIPALESVPEDEIRRYTKDLGPAAVRSYLTEAINLELFWKSAFEAVPNLANCARHYIFATISSADAERSFKTYNFVLSDKRRCLPQVSMRQLVFLRYNNFVGDFFD